MSLASEATQEHRWFKEPTEPVNARFITSLVIAQLLFFIALLGPAIVGMALKVQAIVPDAQKAGAIATVMGVGATAALIANCVFGRLSDRTTSRFGRRRPWIIAGTILMTIAFLVIALGQSVPVVAAGWFFAQLGANATFSPFIATIADQVPEFQRAKISAMLGIAQNVGILGGTYVAEVFSGQMMIMFVGPAVVAVVAMTVYALILPDQVLPQQPPSMTLKDWFTTFWVSPIKHTDFALNWWSRFLITLGSFMFTTFRLFFLQDRMDLTEKEALGVITMSVLIYTVALVISGYVAGWLSDRTGRRKPFVAASCVLFGIGTALLANIHTVGGFYGVEALMGFAYGIYMGVDLALVVDVLPDPDDAAKDLGVFNIANAMPQTLAPVVGAALVGLGATAADPRNYIPLCIGAGVSAIIGGVLVLFIRKVK